jgi:putative SOS response-associated peptidase YedK
MCGRVIQASPPDLLGLTIVAALDGRDNRIPTDHFGNMPARYNGAPSQELWVIRRRPDTGERSLDLLRWGLIPSWCKEKPKPPPINAKGETAAKLPMFREAFARRRCILPIDGFYEWRAIKGAKVKQPYAIAMKDRSPFGLAGLWENWKEPATGEWIRTFCVITVPANEMVSAIHDRMPAILKPGDYDAWLAGDGNLTEMLRSFPSEPMTMWPISTRVNSPKNDDAGLLDVVVEAASARRRMATARSSWAHSFAKWDAVTTSCPERLGRARCQRAQDPRPLTKPSTPARRLIAGLSLSSSAI